MKLILFGAVLGLLVAFPTLLAFVLAVVATIVPQPVVLAFGASVLLWPRLARTVRRWAG